MKKNLILNSRVYLIVLALLLLVLSNVFSLFFFPPTEGWWQTYGYLYNQNLKLYREINTAYTPLFIIFNAYLLKITDLFIVHRIIGLLFILISFVFLIITLKKLKYSFVTSLVSSFIAVQLSMLNVVYIVYDYPVILNFFVIVSLYFFVTSWEEKSRENSALFSDVFVALFSILAFFTKQNVGAILIAGYLLAYVFILSQQKTRGRVLGFAGYLVGLFVFFIILSSWTGVDLDTLAILTVQNDSKGSLITVLGRVFEKDNLRIYGQSIAIVVFLYIINRHDIFVLAAKKFKVSQALFFQSMLIFILLLILLSPEKFMILVIVSYLIYLAMIVFAKRNEGALFFVLVGHVLAITMTSNLSIAGVWLIGAFALAFLLKFFEDNISLTIYRNVCVGFMVAIFATVTNAKVKVPYTWWGLNQSQVSDAKYDLPFEEMRFLKVDRVTSMFFNDVKRFAERSQPGDMYFFPHIPVFYKLYQSRPVTPNLIQWFDVITSKNLEVELAALKDKRPSLVVVFEPPWIAYVGHAGLKNSELLQPKFLEYLDESVANGTYKLERYQIFDNNRFGDNMGRYDDLDISLKVLNPDIFGKMYSEVFNDQTKIDNNFTILSIKHVGIKTNADLEKFRFSKNDIVTVRVRLSLLEQLVKIIGAPDGLKQDYCSYRIYTKVAH